jgi:cbb3-type cytochrome oxidase subunit 3
MMGEDMRTKTILFILTAIILLMIICPRIDLNIGIAQGGSGRKIDAFTQKAPFDGKGPNQPSDAFQPQELVILYALVTYNDAPVAGKLVAFAINGPPNLIQNKTISGSSISDGSGMANFSFRIPWPDVNAETIVFGEWNVVATVDIADIAVTDTLTFRVGWIVKIKTITTLNDQLMPQNSFLRQRTIFFNLTLENIAFTPKTATIIVDAVDAADYPIIHVELYDLILQPGESYALAFSNIPLNAEIGESKVSAFAYTARPTQGGILYSPAAHTTFEIINRDLAIISLTPSKTVAEIGETIDIAMIVKNKGTDSESFDVSTYSNQTLIDKKHVTALPPSMETQVIFTWNTSGEPEGNYVISGVADVLEGEIDVADNKLTDGIITLYTRKPSVTVDVAVSYVNAQPLVVQIGQPVQITVRVKNLGNIPENFNTTILYDNVPLAVLPVDFLAPGAEKELAYTWDTSNMMEGNYTIKAYIPPLPDEQNIANNLYADGTVWIKAPHPIVKEHNIAITAVNASAYQVYVGDNVEITVKVADLGDFAETTNVTAHANMLNIDSRNFLYLEAHSDTILSLIWNTSNMNPGNYTIWAFADYVPGETNLDDNLFIDGIVTLRAPPVHYIHDIAVISVQPQSQSIFIGQELTILATVKNKGNSTESFNVTLYYDSTPIQKITVYSLPPTNEQTLTFQWDTSNVEAGNYTISAYAEPVPGETNLANNRFTDGTVEVKKPQPSITRDIAVVFLSASPIEVEAGENVTITVTVLNLGSMPESFNTTVYYDSNVIQVIPVTALVPYVPETMTIGWNTKNVKPGVYTISANATILEGETNTANNSRKYGNVTIKPPPGLPSWLWLMLFLIGLALLALLLLLLLLLLYRRRKKKEKAATTSRYIILAHPHI